VRVREIPDLVSGNTVALFEFADAPDYGFDWFRRGRLLQDEGLPVPFVHREQIREGPADIDADAERRVVWRQLGNQPGRCRG
jgi:hypothetical protein